ncbi:MAG: GTPase [Methylococcales bacterium]|nr:GTPase [Methylococcales bacterium]
MAYEYSEWLDQARQWAQHAQRQGWLSARQRATFDHTQLSPASHLNDASDEKPLVVAFMGGTGVGKSSLLNRLADQDIAQTGIRRPTSREVTLYHHQQLDSATLSAQLPTTEVVMACHQQHAFQQVVWLDMPDIDSIETQHRDMVWRWLPYIDVLLYVVSPERYRDDRGWRLLLQEGHKHAWLFVINHWDQGDASQRQAFAQQLIEAGFNEPLILATSCTAQVPDDFIQLGQTIQTLAKTQANQHIHQRNNQLRCHALRQCLIDSMTSIGDLALYRNVLKNWRQTWTTLTETLEQSYDWPLKKLAQSYAAHDRPPAADAELFWDQWAQSRFEDTLDQVLQTLTDQGLPTTPLKNRWQSKRSQIGVKMRDQLDLAARAALARPGYGWQRGLLKLLRFLEVTLPMGTMSWVGFQAYQGFYQSSLTQQNYLGLNFAIHAVLLISLSWLLPFFLHKKLQPSLEQSALRGLRLGLKQGLAQIAVELEQDINQMRKDHEALLLPAQALNDELSQAETTPDQTGNSDLLKTMLLPFIKT